MRPEVDHDDLGMRALEELVFRQIAKRVGNDSEIWALERELAECLEVALEGLHRGAAADHGWGWRIAADLTDRCLRRIKRRAS